MKTIKVLGTGCPNCIKLEFNVIEALKQTGIKANIEKITDITDIMSYGVMGTPALVIDEKVVSSGKVNEIGEIIDLLNKGNSNNDGKSYKGCCCGGNC